MQELEKILEEINRLSENHINKAFELVKKEPLTQRYTETDIEQTKAHELAVVKDIIRKHMNDGWIPSNKHLPKAPEMEDEYPEFNVMIEGAKTPTTLQYTHEGIWVDDYGNVYNVIAWQPLPEPYIPRNQNKPEEHYPEWRAKLLNKFDRRE